MISAVLLSQTSSSAEMCLHTIVLFFHNKGFLICRFFEILYTEILKLFDPKKNTLVKMLLTKNRFWTRFSGEIGVPSGTGLVAVVLTRQHGHGDDRAKSDGAG